MKTIISVFTLFLIGSVFQLQAKDFNSVVYPSNNLESELLFVILVPIDAANQAEINEMKNMKVDGVKIQEVDGHLTLEYVGSELISEVSPDFVEEITVYKGAEAKAKYPHAPKDGVIEIFVMDAKTLSNVIHSIKSN